jgi:hypothetical protein
MNEARGVVIDRQVVAVPDFACSEGTRDTIIVDVVKSQEDLMKQPVGDTEIEKWENGEPCDRRVILLLSYASLDYRRRVMPIIRTFGVVYGLQVDRRFELTVINLLIFHNLRTALRVHVSHPPACDPFCVVDLVSLSGDPILNATQLRPPMRARFKFPQLSTKPRLAGSW